MARIPYADALNAEPGDLLAILASAVNPDGTPFTLPADNSLSAVVGQYLVTPPTLADTATSPLLLGLRAALGVSIIDKDGVNGAAVANLNTDTYSASSQALAVKSGNYILNQAGSWDRQRG